MSRPLLRTAAVSTSLLMTAGLGLTVTPANADTPPSWPVVASGLNNPRQLTFADHALYVAEAGTGALGTHGTPTCMTGGEGAQVCFGTTGSLTKITRHGQERVLTGLPSLADQGGTADDPAGSSAIGPSDIAITCDDQFVLSIGLGNDPAVRSQLPRAGRDLGTLVEGSFEHHGREDHGRENDRRSARHHGRSHHHGHSDHHDWATLADIAGYEATSNPVDNPDSNPVAILREGRHFLVADAGGNTIVKTGHHGQLSTIAAFQDTMVDAPPNMELPPQIRMQFVPTSVVRGPDGAYYVSQLTGFPFPVGGSTVWRVVPGETPTVYASGLTNVTDLAFDDDGSLYAVEIAAQGLLTGPVGAVMRIPAGGGTPEVVADQLFAPYGIALHDDSAYVTTGSVAPGVGQVIRIPLS